MAETTLTVNKVSHGTRTGGTTPTWDCVDITTLTAANEDGSCWVDDGKTFLVMHGSASPSVVTVTKQKANDEGVTEHLVTTVGIGVTKIVGPFGADYVSATDGKVHATWTNYAGLTLKAYRLADDPRG